MRVRYLFFIEAEFVFCATEETVPHAHFLDLLFCLHLGHVDGRQRRLAFVAEHGITWA